MPATPLTEMYQKNTHTNVGRYVLKMTDISKAFSGVTALSEVNLKIAYGEVHALMGENGAGKSTLMKILSGIYQKDSGTIFLEDKPVNIKSPKEALDVGISMIHQELNPVYAMTVSENIFLGKEPCYGLTSIINRKKQRKLTETLLKALDIALDPEARLEELSVAQMQMVEIVKAVSWDSKIIIMDEPTSAITETEVNKLFAIIKSLKKKGVSVIYISHKMDEIFRISDSITILRDGQLIATQPASELDSSTLIKLMVGRDIDEIFPAEKREIGKITLEVEGLGNEVFRNISFKAHEGEVLGFAGLMGAGRTEVMETLFGIIPYSEGKITIEGKEVKIKYPADAIRHGIALITEDRKQKGLNLKGSVKANITLACLSGFSSVAGVLQPEKEERFVDDEIEKFSIKTRNRNQQVSTLSGGNQQKVVLSKWLATDPQIIIFDEPTRGIDVGAKAEIYTLIRTLAKKGKTILLVSSEMPEIIGLCDRVLVLHQGRITRELQGDELIQETIMEAATGHK